MRTGILISSRMASTRLPGKAMMEIEGRRLIERLIDRMKRVAAADEIILCTTTKPEDDVIVAVAEENSIWHFRGDEFDVMDRFILAARQFEIDVIVRATGDNPLTCPEQAQQAIELHRTSEADVVLMPQMPIGTKTEVILTEALEYAHQHALDRSGIEYMTFYFNQPRYFRIQTLEVPADLRRPECRLTVDTEEDLALMKAVHRRLGPDRYIPLNEVIALLDQDEELRKLNQHIRKKPAEGMVNTKFDTDEPFHRSHSRKREA